MSGSNYRTEALRYLRQLFSDTASMLIDFASNRSADARKPYGKTMYLVFVVNDPAAATSIHSLSGIDGAQHHVTPFHGLSRLSFFLREDIRCRERMPPTMLIPPHPLTSSLSAFAHLIWFPSPLH